MKEQVDGVPKNFIENVIIHQNNIIQHFCEVPLDFSLESINALDSIFKNPTQRKIVLQDSSLFYGLLAYCGQVIINTVEEGEWSLYSCDENTSKPRYYPYIRNKNKEHEFYGDIERFLELDEGTLAWRIRQATNPFKLDVVPITDWYFPPLKDSRKKN